VEQIDETDVTNVDKSYILPDFSEKEADLVYRVKFKGEDNLNWGSPQSIWIKLR
jgi:hypothetical protein